MTIIRDHAQLADAWVATRPAAPAGDAGSFDAREAIARFGVTADSPLNTYSAGKWLDEHAREFLGKRLDYVLFRAPAPSAAQGGARPALRATECRVVLTEHVPGAAFSHSDHFGLAATFAIAPAPAAGAENAAARGAQDASVPPASALTHASVNTVIDALTTCGRLSRALARVPRPVRRERRAAPRDDRRVRVAAALVGDAGGDAVRGGDDVVRDDDVLRRVRLRPLGGERAPEHYRGARDPQGASDQSHLSATLLWRTMLEIMLSLLCML
jgi:hypothetical protein